MSPRLLLAVTVAAGAAACNGGAHRANLELRDRCDALVPGQSTLGDADVAFSPYPAQPRVCVTNFTDLGAGDACPYASGTTTICEYDYFIPTTDCSGPVAGGACYSRCSVRVAGTSSDVICGRRFDTSQ